MISRPWKDRICVFVSHMRPPGARSKTTGIQHTSVTAAQKSIRRALRGNSSFRGIGLFSSSTSRRSTVDTAARSPTHSRIFSGRFSPGRATRSWSRRSSVNPMRIFSESSAARNSSGRRKPSFFRAMSPPNSNPSARHSSPKGRQLGRLCRP